MKLNNLKAELEISRMEATTPIFLLSSEEARAPIKFCACIIYAVDVQAVLFHRILFVLIQVIS